MNFRINTYFCGMSVTIQILSQHFLLHPSRFIFWQEQKMLFIADVHLGKIAHFRKHGAAVPAHAAYQNLEALTEIVNELNPDTICFLGDLFHSNLNNEWNDFKKWVAYINTEIILIEGNHDIIPPKYYTEIGVPVLDNLQIGSFLLTHHPTESTDFFNFCGHVHPGIMVRGVGGQTFRLPCFFKTNSRMILPAFGNFTGKHIIKPTRTDEVFAVVEGKVISIK